MGTIVKKLKRELCIRLFGFEYHYDLVMPWEKVSESPLLYRRKLQRIQGYKPSEMYEFSGLILKGSGFGREKYKGVYGFIYSEDVQQNVLARRHGFHSAKNVRERYGDKWMDVMATWQFLDDVHFHRIEREYCPWINCWMVKVLMKYGIERENRATARANLAKRFVERYQAMKNSRQMSHQEAGGTVLRSAL